MNGTNYEVPHCGAFFTPHSHTSWAKIFVCVCLSYNNIYSHKKLNLWLTVPKGATPVNETPATDWQMKDNVISITVRQVYQCRLS